MVLITRFGASKVEEHLPNVIRTVHEAGYAGKVRESLEQLYGKSSADNFMVRG